MSCKMRRNQIWSSIVARDLGHVVIGCTKPQSSERPFREFMAQVHEMLSESSRDNVPELSPSTCPGEMLLRTASNLRRTRSMSRLPPEVCDLVDVRVWTMVRRTGCEPGVNQGVKQGARPCRAGGHETTVRDGANLCGPAAPLLDLVSPSLLSHLRFSRRLAGSPDGWIGTAKRQGQCILRVRGRWLFIGWWIFLKSYRLTSRENNSPGVAHDNLNDS